MQVINEIKEVVKWLNEELDVRMYILDQTYSKKPEKMYVVRRVGITDDVKKTFVEIPLTHLAGINYSLEEKARNIKSFFDLDASNYDIFLINPEEVYVFPYILDQINQYSSLKKLTDIEEIKKIKGYALEIKTESGNRVIYFRKFTESKILTKKGWTAFALFNGVFNSVKGDVFTIDGGIDCVYIEKSDSEAKSIVINNKRDFEDLFNFKEYYFTNAFETINSEEFSEFVEMSEHIVELINEKVSYAKKITNLTKSSSLDSTLRDVFEASKEKLPALRYEISDGKINIKDENGLRDFIEIWEDNVVQSIARGRLYRARGKEEFES